VSGALRNYAFAHGEEINDALFFSGFHVILFILRCVMELVFDGFRNERKVNFEPDRHGLPNPYPFELVEEQARYEKLDSRM